MVIELMLAVNNHNGVHAGRVDEIEVLRLGDLILHLEGDSTRCRVAARDRERQVLYIDKLKLYLYLGYKMYVGNVIWDCAPLYSVQAARAINYLRKLGWDCVEGESNLFDKYRAGEEVTVAELEALYNE